MTSTVKLKHAMILAAGFGTRLRPLTDTTPKALIPYKGSPMILNVINKLAGAGIENITVNTHYLSGQVEEYFKEKNFGVKINLVHEKDILGTGGGIKNARSFLEGTGDFLVYNVDVDSDIDIQKMYTFHRSKEPLATLAVMKRDTSRPLLVDEECNLLGRVVGSEQRLHRAPQKGEPGETAFCGVHILSSEIFDKFPEEALFDIVLFYMNMIKQGERIVCCDIGDTYWKDLGTLKDLGYS
jgi:N-acetyl-alpha-D-muramate 1-phosphate uridylyltransferase